MVHTWCPFAVAEIGVQREYRLIYVSGQENSYLTFVQVAP